MSATATDRRVGFKRNDSTMSHEARCDSCGKLIASVTYELMIRVRRAGQPAFLLSVRHLCEESTR